MSMQQIMFASLAAGGGGYVIEGSGLFTDEYIKRTEVDGSSDQKMYFSCVVKPAKINKAQALFYVSDAANYTERSWIAIGQTGNHIELLDIKAGSVQLSLVTTAAFRDFSAYLHIEVLYDTTQSTAADRNILKVNGTRITDFSTETNFTQNDTFGSAGISGEFAGVGGTVLPGGSSEMYIAQAVRVDGDPAGIALGETTDNGFYQLKDPSEESLTFGNNGFLLSGQNLATGTDSQAGGTLAGQQVITLLHMDGDDASTTFTDSSSYSQTFTAGGNAQIDTAVKLFGTGSGLFDGTGDRLVMTADSHFAHGTAWTAEGWFRKTANGNGTEAVYYQGNDHYVFYARAASSTNSGVSFYFNGTTIAGSTSMTDSNWHHWAMVRDGATARAFIDGTSVGTGSPSWATSTATDVVNIGSQNASNYFTGHMDEVRITTGLARYTGNFTAPSAAFTNPATANHFTPVGTITATNDSPTNGDA